MSTPARWSLWTHVADAVQRSFPDRAPALLAAIDRDTIAAARAILGAE